MRFYFKIGLRNLMKNPRRSWKTLLTIVIGLSACLLVQGFMSYTMNGLGESLISGGLGHLQIYQKGYLEHGMEDPFHYLISDSDAFFVAIKQRPEVKLYAPRLFFQGIASAGEKSAVFAGTAGIPKKEKVLNSEAGLTSGVFLADDNPYGVVIGSGLARKLGVTVGDTITIQSALPSGAINAVDMEICGIAQAQMKAYDDLMLLANLKTIQEFMDVSNSVDRVIILLARTDDLTKIRPFITALCKQHGLEYRNWIQLAGIQYNQPQLFYRLIYLLIMGIVVLVVILSITNTLNLAMQERVREIGTIRAIGTTRLQIGGIFMAESLLMGLIGGLLGILTGYGVAFLLNICGGIPIPAPPGHARGYTAFFTPGWLTALQLFGIFTATATVAGFYPAFRAARRSIIDALRWM